MKPGIDPTVDYAFKRLFGVPQTRALLISLIEAVLELYYWAKFHQQQIQEGDRYEVLRPTVCICFLNGALFPGAADYRLQFELWERRHNVAFTGQIGIFLVELGKFGRGHDEIVTPLDRWAWFLKHGAELDAEAVPANVDTPEIRRAFGGTGHVLADRSGARSVRGASEVDSR